MIEVELQNVSKSYKDKDGKFTKVLDNISMQIEKNEFVCFLGKSGCGKSTMLNLMAGYIKADQGNIIINKKLISGPSQERGVVFQEHALFPWYTVLENIAFGPRVNHLRNVNKIAEEYLKMIDLEEYRDYYPGQLSGGMKQRVGIARAFANRPAILLMDEPFSALDAKTRENMQEQLLNIWEKAKTTVVFITHSIDEAITLADRVIVLGNGKIIDETVVDMERPRRKESSEFNKYMEHFEKVINGDE